MAKWIELLRVGKFRDRHGVERDVTQQNIDSIAANYRENESNAPALIGHPGKDKVPAFGVFSALKTLGDKLLGLPGEMVPEFAALVRKGGFPDVSVGLNKAMDKLTHVAFLSAEKPAVDGLAPVCEFSAPDDDDSAVALVVTDNVKAQLPEFASPAENALKWRVSDIATVLRNIKNWLIEKEGQETSDKLIPEYLLTSLSDSLPEPVVASPMFSASEKAALESAKAVSDLIIIDLRKAVDTSSSKLAEFSASVQNLAGELSAQKDTNAELLIKLTDYKKQLRTVEFSAYVEKLIDERRVAPDQKTEILNLLETMHTATPVEFSTASGELSPVDKYKAELASRPVIVSLGETPAPEFSTSGNDDPVAKGMRARAYIDEQAAKGITVNVFEALKHV